MSRKRLIPMRRLPRYAFLLACGLSACATPRPEGQWRPIAAPVLYFAGVQLAETALDKGWPEVCHEAQTEIDKQLRQRLPGRIAPLTLRSGRPEPGDAHARLAMAIESCEVDSDQTGGTFWFYLTLRLRVTLSDGGRELMQRAWAVSENARSSTPSPLYEFTFAEPVRQTLVLFDGPRVLVPPPD